MLLVLNIKTSEHIGVEKIGGFQWCLGCGKTAVVKQGGSINLGRTK